MATSKPHHPGRGPGHPCRQDRRHARTRHRDAGRDHDPLATGAERHRPQPESVGEHRDLDRAHLGRGARAAREDQHERKTTVTGIKHPKVEVQLTGTDRNARAILDGLDRLTSVNEEGMNDPQVDQDEDDRPKRLSRDKQEIGEGLNAHEDDAEPAGPGRPRDDSKASRQEDVTITAITA